MLLKLYRFKALSISITMLGLAIFVADTSLVMRVLTNNYQVSPMLYQLGFLVSSCLYMLVAVGKARPNYAMGAMFHMFTASTFLGWMDGAVPLTAVIIHVSYSATLVLDVLFSYHIGEE